MLNNPYIDSSFNESMLRYIYKYIDNDDAVRLANSIDNRITNKYNHIALYNINLIYLDTVPTFIYNTYSNIGYDLLKDTQINYCHIPTMIKLFNEDINKWHYFYRLMRLYRYLTISAKNRLLKYMKLNPNTKLKLESRLLIEQAISHS